MRIGTTPLWSAAIAIYIPSMLMTLGQGMLIPALPVLGDEFGVSGAIAIQALTAQLLGRGLAGIPSGIMVDRYGTKLPMVVGATVAMASALGAALAPNFAVVIICLFVWGTGMSMWMMGREIAAFDMVQVDQRGRQMSMLMGIGATGVTMGPAIGGVLTDMAGVQALFFTYAGAATVVLAISLAHKDSGVKHQRTSGKLFNFSSFQEIKPYFRITYLILFLSTFGQMVRGQVTNSMLPLYTQEQLSYSATTTGLLFSVIGVVTFLMIVPTGFISDKLGRKWAAAPAAVLSTIGFIAFPFAETVVALSVVGVIIGLANGLAMGAMTIYTYDIVPNHARGQLQGMRRTFGEFGSVASPPVGGLIASAYSPSTAFWIFAPLHAISAFLLIFVAKESLQKHPKAKPM